VKLLGSGCKEDLLEDLPQKETAATEAVFLFPYFFLSPIFERTARENYSKTQFFLLHPPGN